MWGLKKRLPIAEGYLQTRDYIDKSAVGTLRFVVSSSGGDFILDPERFSLREGSFQQNWTFAVFCVATLMREDKTLGLCEFSLDRVRGDMITRQPLVAFLSSGRSISRVQDQ